MVALRSRPITFRMMLSERHENHRQRVYKGLLGYCEQER
jgi:hypothetical protein